MNQSSRWAGAILAVGLACGSLRAQTTEIVSVATSGEPGDWISTWGIAVSGNGRFAAFYSWASNLVPGDANGEPDVFVRDRKNGTTQRVSVSTNGTEGDDDSGRLGFSISADGRFVAFGSEATNLVAGDTNHIADVFVRDLRNGTTERVSLSTAGVQANLGAEEPSISADGRFVAFESQSSSLVPGDTNGSLDVFVRDLSNGTTELVSVPTGSSQGLGQSVQPSISADGRFVAFESADPTLVPGDTNSSDDIFVHDRQTGRTVRVSVATGGAQGNFQSYGKPSISADGRFVAFFSEASNLVANDTNGFGDLFVHDRLTGTTELVSVATGGAQADSRSVAPTISADGRFVAFTSTASNLVSGDTNGVHDAFLRDRYLGTTVRVSLTADGAQGNAFAYGASISSDGRFVAFNSGSSDLVSGDTNGWVDGFVRDTVGAPYFTSSCDPGFAGVIPCPCSNPPAGTGHGCDNSFATGGAVLSASGATVLSSDGLVFTTSGEPPSATSLVLQGDSFAANGIVFGQGVRCAAGTLERLYTKHASGGGITAPDFGAGDPTVSARSAALGSVIQAGASRWYVVAYRDPTVLGGCSATSTWNVTQTGQVVWWW